MTDLRDQLRTYFDALTDDVLADNVDAVPAWRHGHRRTTWFAAAAAVVVVAVVAAFLVVSDGARDARVSVAPAQASRTVLLGYSFDRDTETLEMVDPSTGETLRTFATTGACWVCRPFVLGDTIWGGDGKSLFRVDSPYVDLMRVDVPPGWAFPSVDGSTVWVGGGTVGAASVRRVDATTNEVGPTIPLPAGYLWTDPPAEVVGGILVFSSGYPRSLAIWNPETRALRELAADVSNLGSAYTHKGAQSSLVVYRDARSALHIVETTTRRSIPITVNGEPIRGIGGGAFSPDGKTIAAFLNVSTSDVGGVTGGRIAQLMLVDAATGAGRVIEHPPVVFGEEYGWATWAPDGSRVFFGTGGGAYAVGVNDSVATELPIAAKYSWTALDVPAPRALPSTPTTPTTLAAPTVTNTSADTVRATWTPMDAAAGTFPNGAGVTSIVRFRNRLLAAGNVYGTDVQVANPVVWTSTNGGPWTRTWDAGAVTGGSSSNPHLVVIDDEAWILHSGTAGTVAWRSSDGVRWDPLDIPNAMRAVSVFDAAEHDGVIVAVSGDKFGRGDVLWRSDDGGATWEDVGSALGPNVAPRSVAATADGFVIGGTDVDAQRPLVWTSSDGREWTNTELAAAQGQVWSVGAVRNAVVVDGTAGNEPAVWYRSDGSWVRGDTRGTQTITAAPNERLQVLRTGFVSVDARADALRTSQDGRTWVDVVSQGAPSGTVVISGSSGDSLIAFVVETDAAGRDVLRPYRVEFTASEASASTSGTASLTFVTDVAMYPEGRCTTGGGVEIPCDEPHGNEEFVAFTMPSGTSLAPEACRAYFDDYTGLVYEQVKDRYSVVALRDALDETRFRCLISGPGGGGASTLVGSARRH